MLHLTQTLYFANIYEGCLEINGKNYRNSPIEMGKKTARIAPGVRGHWMERFQTSSMVKVKKLLKVIRDNVIKQHSSQHGAIN